MRKSSILWTTTAVGMGAALLALSLTNPALSEYQAQVLGPAAQERRNSSDALFHSSVSSNCIVCPRTAKIPPAF